MVDFLFDNFYEVLSGEGIWVLILIGSALAVASFILLTMKIEVNPKQNKLNNVMQPAVKKETILQDKSKKRKLNISLKGKSKSKDNTVEGVPAARATVGMPVRPEVVQQEHMEQVNVEMTGHEGFDIPALPEMEDQASLLDDTTGPELQEDLQTEAEMNLDTVEEESSETEEENADQEKSEEGENHEKGKGDSDASSIFDIFTNSEEEESGISELAKNMEDVTINGLLSDTETLSEELKNIFTKHRRA